MHSYFPRNHDPHSTYHEGGQIQFDINVQNVDEDDNFNRLEIDNVSQFEYYVIGQVRPVVAEVGSELPICVNLKHPGN